MLQAAGPAGVCAIVRTTLASYYRFKTPPRSRWRGGGLAQTQFGSSVAQSRRRATRSRGASLAFMHLWGAVWTLQWLCVEQSVFCCFLHANLSFTLTDFVGYVPIRQIHLNTSCFLWLASVYSETSFTKSISENVRPPPTDVEKSANTMSWLAGTPPGYCWFLPKNDLFD